MHNLPDYVTSLPHVVLNTFTIYVFLIFAFRIFGRRQLGQLTVIDLVVVLIMGSAVETAMINGNISLSAGLVCAATLLATNRLITFLASRSKKFRKFVSGNPVVLISHGHLLEENLKATGMTEADILEALRGRGCDAIDCVSYAIMEEDGQISVVENDAKVIRTKQPLKPQAILK